MSDEDPIEELKRIIEEEKQQEVERKRQQYQRSKESGWYERNKERRKYLNAQKVAEQTEDEAKQRAEKRRQVNATQRAKRKIDQEKRERFNALQKRYIDKLRADPERYAQYREKKNTARYTQKYVRGRQENMAGRSKPETCEICGRGGLIVFEHDHKTNKFRGWTCQPCNVVIGMSNEDIVILEKVIVYLKAHQDDGIE